MPELAEVEFYRKQWQPALGEPIQAVAFHAQARIFRQIDPVHQLDLLAGCRLTRSLAHGKNLLHQFTPESSSQPERWLGTHLGMTGALRADLPGLVPGRHDHLVLRTSCRSIVFTDPRLFGVVRFHLGPNPPAWWAALPPEILSPGFTVDRVSQFLQRHSKAPIKSTLLNQECFPGIGNWMADEILWRAGLYPHTLSGTLSKKQTKHLWEETRQVCETALEIIGTTWAELPLDWLFQHRWKKGGICPRSGQALQYDRIGGRTTCWSPALQKA